MRAFLRWLWILFRPEPHVVPPVIDRRAYARDLDGEILRTRGLSKIMRASSERFWSRESRQLAALRGSQTGRVCVHVHEEGAVARMNLEKARKVCRMVVDDMAADARHFDGKPFDGRTVAEYLGRQGAAIAALANLLDDLLEIRMNERDRVEELTNR